MIPPHEVKRVALRAADRSLSELRCETIRPLRAPNTVGVPVRFSLGHDCSCAESCLETTAGFSPCGIVDTRRFLVEGNEEREFADVRAGTIFRHDFGTHPPCRSQAAVIRRSKSSEQFDYRRPLTMRNATKPSGGIMTVNPVITGGYLLSSHSRQNGCASMAARETCSNAKTICSHSNPGRPGSFTSSTGRLHSKFLARSETRDCQPGSASARFAADETARLLHDKPARFLTL